MCVLDFQNEGDSEPHSPHDQILPSHTLWGDCLDFFGGGFVYVEQLCGGLHSSRLLLPYLLNLEKLLACHSTENTHDPEEAGTSLPHPEETGSSLHLLSSVSPVSFPHVSPSDRGSQKLLPL